MWWESGRCRPGGHFCFMFSLTHVETESFVKNQSHMTQSQRGDDSSASLTLSCDMEFEAFNGL